MPTTHRFEGFSSPNTTQVPDEFFDVLLPVLREAELRVLLYIIRRTFGFKKQADCISFNQFMNGITTRDGRRLDSGCGIRSRGHLSAALKRLEEQGVITSYKTVDERLGNQTTSYALRFRAAAGVVPFGNQGSSPSEPGWFPNGTSSGSPTVPPLVPQANPQHTGVQGTERQTDQHQTERGSKTSKALSDLDKAVAEVSRDLGDLQHVRSNRTRARNLGAQYGLDEFSIIRLVRAAHETTKPRLGELERPMAYFFETLEDRCQTAPGAHRSLAGKYWRMVQR